VRRESNGNSKFTCEFCSKKVCMVIKEYGTGRWLCYECHYRKDIPKNAEETLQEKNIRHV